MLVTLSKAQQMLQEEGTYFIAGEQALLEQLPQGNWLGGTIPYFMSEAGGQITKEQLFISKAPAQATLKSTKAYSPDQLADIPGDAAHNGFSVIIIPASSEAHIAYAEKAPTYPELFMHPIIGWIAGVHLDDLGTQTPKGFLGTDLSAHDNAACVMHFELPAETVASIGIVNIFEQGQGDVITFETSGFAAQKCKVNGQETSLAAYITGNGIDTRLPLVADYHGSRVNVSFQNVDEATGQVTFYAPVFPDVEYRIAAPVDDYVNEFNARLGQVSITPAFSCNCILNFLYGELEGKQTGDIQGPITFGEIAYQLLNQTLTYLELRHVQ